MPSYTKRPKVTRFKRQQTGKSRSIRVATVARRERPKRAERTKRTMRPTKTLRKR